MRAIGKSTSITKEIQAKDEQHLRQTRLYKETIPQLLFEVEINLYGKSKIGIMSFKEQIGLIIESKEIFNTLKSIFELNWKMLEK